MEFDHPIWKQLEISTQTPRYGSRIDFELLLIKYPDSKVAELIKSITKKLI